MDLQQQQGLRPQTSIARAGCVSDSGEFPLHLLIHAEFGVGLLDCLDVIDNGVSVQMLSSAERHENGRLQTRMLHLDTNQVRRCALRKLTIKQHVDRTASKRVHIGHTVQITETGNYK